MVKTADYIIDAALIDRETATLQASTNLYFFTSYGAPNKPRSTYTGLIRGLATNLGIRDQPVAHRHTSQTYGLCDAINIVEESVPATRKARSTPALRSISQSPNRSIHPFHQTFPSAAGMTNSRECPSQRHIDVITTDRYLRAIEGAMGLDPANESETRICLLPASTSGAQYP